MGIVGSIMGDIAGSRFEARCSESVDGYELFGGSCRFTDDTVMSVATMDAMRHGRKFEEFYAMYGKKYPDAGYGPSFRGWIFADEPLYDAEIAAVLHPDGACTERKAYNSYGNGSAMRAGVIGQYYRHVPFWRVVEKAAVESAVVSHNHPEGIKGAVVMALCVWMAERGYGRDEILGYAAGQYPSRRYEFGCDLPLDSYIHRITHDTTCMGTVPVAVRMFYEFDNFDLMCRTINSIPCDTDTICSMAGCIYESFHACCTDDDRGIMERYLDGYLMGKLPGMRVADGA